MTIKKMITEWVRDNFGESEVEDPSWNIDLLAKHIEKELQKKADNWLDILNYWEDEIRDVAERFDDKYWMYKNYNKMINDIYRLTKGE